MKAVQERDWNVFTTCTVLILHKTVLLTTTALPMKSFCGVGEAFISDLAYQHFKCSQISNGYNKELLLPDDFTISGETTHVILRNLPALSLAKRLNLANYSGCATVIDATNQPRHPAAPHLA
jgi:hypothetical protein